MSTPAPARGSSVSLTRRTLVAGSAVGAVALGHGLAAAQPASPVAIDLEAFRQLNLTVTGAEKLDDDGLQQLLDLFLADEGMTDALQTLIAELPNPDFDLRAADFSLIVVITNILQFWYLGSFRNAPLPNRPQRVAHLTSYAALPYFTAPAVCKAFGYWATDPGLE